MVDKTPRHSFDTNYQIDEDWDYNDEFNALDELIAERGSFAERPAEGTYPNELYYAFDHRIVYRWDDVDGSWAVFLGLGADGTPVPGDTVLEHLEATSELTDPAGVTHTGELADVDDLHSRYTDEEVMDVVDSLLAGGSNVSATYDDANDTLTIDTAALNPEEVRDEVGALLAVGADLTITVDDAADTVTIGLDTHAENHQSGGSDELSVDGLSGDLGDPQDPKTHGVNEHDNTVPELADGVVLSSQIPDLAITETYSVADETERLALNAEEGDVAIQSNESRTYIFTGGDPSSNSNWSNVLFPEPPVDTVFGRTGDITAQAGDYTYSDITGTHGNEDHDSDFLPSSDYSPEDDTHDRYTNDEAEAAAPVQSVFGRVGAVAAQAGDYAASQIDNFSSAVREAVDGESITPSDVSTGSLEAEEAQTAEQPTGKEGSYVEQRGGIDATVSPTIYWGQPVRTTLRAAYQSGDAVYAFDQTSSNGDVYKSTDKYATIDFQGSVGEDLEYIHRIEATGTLLAWDANANVHRSTDDGNLWTQTFTGANYVPLHQQGITETPSGHLLFGEYESMTNWGGEPFNVFRTTDDGENFNSVLQSDLDRAGDSSNPGHFHYVQYDPAQGEVVALLDYPDVQVQSSDNEGSASSWGVVANETDAKHPNFVSLMFFDDWVAWAYDAHGENGWIRKMSREHFYGGDWALENIHNVAKVNDKMSYASYPIGNDAWLFTQASEANEHPGSYGQEVHIVYSDGSNLRVSDGQSYSSIPPVNAMTTSGNIPWPCGYPYDAWQTDTGHEDYRGTTVLNWKVNLPYEYSSVPMTVGESGNHQSISNGAIGDWVLPHKTDIRGRTSDGGLTSMLQLSGGDHTVLKNGSNHLQVRGDNDRLQYVVDGSVQRVTAPDYMDQIFNPAKMYEGAVMLSEPPSNPHTTGYYMDDGSNTDDETPGFRYTTDGGSNWNDL